MKTLLESAEFQRELPGWVLRGVLCAANSTCWAVAAGFTAPAEIAGMVLGVAFWVTAFSAFGGWVRRRARMPAIRLADALKTAAWIKLLLVLLGLPALFGSHVLPSWSLPLVLGCSADLMLGMISLGFVSRLAGVSDLEQIARLDSLGWTALTTVVEGTLMAVLIVMIASAVLGWRRYRAKADFSPVRSLD